MLDKQFLTCYNYVNALVQQRSYLGITRDPALRLNTQGRVALREGTMKQIELTQGCKATVDDDDFDWLSQYKWCAQKRRRGYYAVRSIRESATKTTSYYMAREIITCPPGLQVDHINHDTLDNRKENLRVCTIAQNQHNQQIKNVNKTSKYKGVSWSPRQKSYRADIVKGKDHWFLGYFKDEEEAASAYDNKALELFREFANLNFREGDRIRVNAIQDVR